MVLKDHFLQVMTLHRRVRELDASELAGLLHQLPALLGLRAAQAVLLHGMLSNLHRVTGAALDGVQAAVEGAASQPVSVGGTPPAGAGAAWLDLPQDLQVATIQFLPPHDLFRIECASRGMMQLARHPGAAVKLEIHPEFPPVCDNMDQYLQQTEGQSGAFRFAAVRHLTATRGIRAQLLAQLGHLQQIHVAGDGRLVCVCLSGRGCWPAWAGWQLGVHLRSRLSIEKMAYNSPYVGGGICAGLTPLYSGPCPGLRALVCRVLRPDKIREVELCNVELDKAMLGEIGRWQKLRVFSTSHVCFADDVDVADIARASAATDSVMQRILCEYVYGSWAISSAWKMRMLWRASPHTDVTMHLGEDEEPDALRGGRVIGRLTITGADTSSPDRSVAWCKDVLKAVFADEIILRLMDGYDQVSDLLFELAKHARVALTFDLSDGVERGATRTTLVEQLACLGDGALAGPGMPVKFGVRLPGVTMRPEDKRVGTLVRQLRRVSRRDVFDISLSTRCGARASLLRVCHSLDLGAAEVQMNADWWVISTPPGWRPPGL